MPRFDSEVHRQSNYWQVRYDAWNGWEAAHVHVSQGGREIIIFTETLDIRSISGRFSNDEIAEAMGIASYYADSNYLYISPEMYINIASKEELQNFKNYLLSLYLENNSGLAR